MTLTVVPVLCFAAAYAAIAAIESVRLGIGFRQALFYMPFKLAYRIDDRQIRIARQAEKPVVYVIVHQSAIDPALMLALLPQDTLHILDPQSAAATWLEPWRELARTIAFKAEHVFVSRRLVRHLRGKGRLAVYIPDAVEPDTKAFRLYRAVARIAARADAAIVPVFIGGARHLPFSLTCHSKAPRQWFPRLRVGVLKPATFAELAERTGGRQCTLSNMLFDRVAESRLAGGNLSYSLFQVMLHTARRSGMNNSPLEDSLNGQLKWKQIFAKARLFGYRICATTAPGEAIGVMLPNTNALVTSLIGLFSANRIATLIDYTSDAATITSSIRTAIIRTVVSSRAFVEKSRLDHLVRAAEQGGARFVWLEDVHAAATMTEKLGAALFHRLPLAHQNSENPAVILFAASTAGDTTRAVVLSHRNLLANCMQAQARIALSSQDLLLNVLPAFRSFGLTIGILLPLLSGVRLFLYPSPLHRQGIAQIAARIRPTILPAPDAFLRIYAQAAKNNDFSSLRLVIAGGEPVRPDTRQIWREKFDTEIIEGYGVAEAAPIIAINSTLHNRHGTVGRLLPAMHMRMEPVKEVPDGGNLWVSGPNLMLGHMAVERPGELVAPPSTGFDTGDIATMDRDGFITIKGRANRLLPPG